MENKFRKKGIHLIKDFERYLKKIKFFNKSTFILKKESENYFYNPKLKRIADWDIIFNEKIILLLNDESNEIIIKFSEIEKIIIYPKINQS
jgi:hypothetical protein